MTVWIHGTMNAWQFGLMAQWMHGSLDSWHNGCMAVWIHGTMDACRASARIIFWGALAPPTEKFRGHI